MAVALGDAVPKMCMGFLDRLTETLTFSDRGVEYQCPACGTVFDTAHHRCQECGELDIRERGSFEFQPK